jgi:hypothetical protein
MLLKLQAKLKKNKAVFYITVFVNPSITYFVISKPIEEQRTTICARLVDLF